MTVAVLDAYKCEFVYQIHRYFKTAKVSLNPCISTAKSAYLDYLLAYQIWNCGDNLELDCALTDKVPVSRLLDCSNAVLTQDCDELLTLDPSYTTTTCPYSFTAPNYPIIKKQHPLYRTLMQAVIPVTFTNPCKPDQVREITSGSIYVNNSTIEDPLFNPRLRIAHTINNVKQYTNGCLLSLYVYNTDAAGQINPTPVHLLVNPVNTPYLNNFNIINPSELYFGHVNYANALERLLGNAMFALTGDATNGDFKVTETNDGYEISSGVSHVTSNPFTGYTTWYGLNWNTSYGVYTKLSAGDTYSSNRHDTKVASITTPLIARTNANTDTGSAILFIECLSPTPKVAAGTNFNNINLSDTYSSVPATFNYSTVPDYKYSVSANVDTEQTITSVIWKDNYNHTVSTELNFEVYYPLTYTVTVHTLNGCEKSDSVVVN